MPAALRHRWWIPARGSSAGVGHSAGRMVPWKVRRSMLSESTIEPACRDQMYTLESCSSRRRAPVLPTTARRAGQAQCNFQSSNRLLTFGGECWTWSQTASSCMVGPVEGIWSGFNHEGAMIAERRKGFLRTPISHTEISQDSMRDDLPVIRARYRRLVGGRSLPEGQGVPWGQVRAERGGCNPCTRSACPAVGTRAHNRRSQTQTQTPARL